MKTITTELLINIHDRVREVCLAKYNVEFDRFYIDNDGSITCYYTPSYQYADEEWYDITIEEIQNANLEDLILARKEKEEEERKKRKEQDRINKEKRLVREKEERKAQYEKLKKEFEP